MITEFSDKGPMGEIHLIQRTFRKSFRGLSGGISQGGQGGQDNRLLVRRLK